MGEVVTLILESCWCYCFCTIGSKLPPPWSEAYSAEMPLFWESRKLWVWVSSVTATVL